MRYVELYFDAEERVIAIKPVEKGEKRDPAVYKITQHGGDLKIRCPSFLWLCQISSGSELYRLRATWSQKEGMLIARLEDEILKRMALASEKEAEATLYICETMFSRISDYLVVSPLLRPGRFCVLKGG